MLECKNCHAQYSELHKGAIERYGQTFCSEECKTEYFSGRGHANMNGTHVTERVSR